MDMDQFDQQIQAMRRRMMTLYRSASEARHQDELLPIAFEELQTAMEELQAAEEELRRKNEELLGAWDASEIDRRRYQELFEFAPDGYIVTSVDGTIRQANRAAAALLNSVEKFLVGRSLALFVPEGERRAFRAEIAQLSRATQVQEREVRLRSWNGPSFDASVRVAVVRSPASQPIALRWMLRDITDRKRAEQEVRELVTGLEQRVAELTARLETVDQAQGRAPAPQHADLGGNKYMQQRYAFLAEASVLLAVALDYEAALGQVARMAVPVLADLCMVDVTQEEGAIRRLAVAHADPAKEELVRTLRDRYPLDPNTRYGIAQALRTGQSQIHSNVPDTLLTEIARDAEHLRLLRQLAATSSMIVPFRRRGQILGVLTFMSFQSGRVYGLEDLALAEELARRATVALDKARLYHEV